MTKTFQSLIGCRVAILFVLNFGHWYLFGICILVLGFFMIRLNEQFC